LLYSIIIDLIVQCAFFFSPPLKINNLLVAEAAENCKAHLTSLLYAELWFNEQKEDEFARNPCKLDFTLDSLAESGARLSQVMRTAYERLGVPDTLLGCGRAHLADSVQRMAHLEQMGRWDMSLVLRDVCGDAEGVARALFHKDLPFTVAQLPATDHQVCLHFHFKNITQSFNKHRILLIQVYFISLASTLFVRSVSFFIIIRSSKFGYGVK